MDKHTISKIIMEQIKRNIMEATGGYDVADLLDYLDDNSNVLGDRTTQEQILTTLSKKGAKFSTNTNVLQTEDDSDFEDILNSEFVEKSDVEVFGSSVECDVIKTTIGDFYAFKKYDLDDAVMEGIEDEIYRIANEFAESDERIIKYQLPVRLLPTIDFDRLSPETTNEALRVAFNKIGHSNVESLGTFNDFVVLEVK